MEGIDFVQGQPETLDVVGPAVLEIQPRAMFNALDIFFHLVVVGVVVQVGVEKGPSKEVLDVLALDRGQRGVEKPARQVPDHVLRALLTESEEPLSILLRRHRRMESWTLDLTSLVEIENQTEDGLGHGPTFEQDRKSPGCRQTRRRDAVSDTDRCDGMQYDDP
jgi:hypothetical protein